MLHRNAARKLRRKLSRLRLNRRRTPGETPPSGHPRRTGAQRTICPAQSIPSGGMVSLNFNRADLMEIIHIIAQQLRLTYTIDPEVKGTVTINSAEPLRPEDLLPMFHQILRMNGAVAVRTGNLYHIMPIKDGKGLARPVGQSREDSFAVQVIPVRFFCGGGIEAGLDAVFAARRRDHRKSARQFSHRHGSAIEHSAARGNRRPDRRPGFRRHAHGDLPAQGGQRRRAGSGNDQGHAVICRLGAADRKFTAQFIALPRINQLLVISHSEAAWTYAKRWLDRIDVVAEGPGRRIFIYPVENGKADELADVLSQALGQPSTGRRDRSSTPTLQDITSIDGGGGMGSATGRGSTGSSFGSSGSSGSSGSFGQQQRGPSRSAYAAVPAPGQPAGTHRPG